MSTTAIPSIFPAEGTFEFSIIHVDLSCATPGARVHYTLDGSEPTMESPVYDRSQGLLPVKGVHGEEVLRTVRAFAEADGLAPSRCVTFTYRFCCFGHGAYRHAMLREPTADTAGLIRIEDYDLDKMFLVIGSRRAVLSDAGFDEQGDLPALCRDLTGGELPVDLVVAHGHPDHIMQARKFLQAGSRVYLPEADLEAAASFGTVFAPGETINIGEGDVLDLGNASLRVYTIPGHTPGGIVLLDEATGDLFASDEFGSNRRYVPDSAWLQINAGATAESCLRRLKQFRQQTAGKLRRSLTGHNDEIPDAYAYLDTLEKAFQSVVDGGQDALVPSLRSAEESFGSSTAAVEGNWRLDPLWAAANLRFLYDADRDAAPPRYARGFSPNVNTPLG